MLWKLMATVVVFVAGMHTVFGQEAVLNNPPATVGLVKAVIEKLDPSYETLWNFRDGTFSQGVSASLYGFTSNEIYIASARLGVGTNESLYGGVGLDLPGLSRRFVPPMVKGIATTKPLDVLWAVTGKYGRVSLVGGYSWGDEAAIYGLTVGAAVTF